MRDIEACYNFCKRDSVCRIFFSWRAPRCAKAFEWVAVSNSFNNTLLVLLLSSQPGYFFSVNLLSTFFKGFEISLFHLFSTVLLFAISSNNLLVMTENEFWIIQTPIRHNEFTECSEWFFLMTTACFLMWKHSDNKKNAFTFVKWHSLQSWWNEWVQKHNVLVYKAHHPLIRICFTCSQKPRTEKEIIFPWNYKMLVF